MSIVIKIDDADSDGRKVGGFKDHRELKIEVTRSEATALMDKLFTVANGGKV